MKLHWAHEAGGSERQFNDALRVYEIQKGTLDLNYLNRWIADLKLQDSWKRLLNEAQSLE